MVLHALQTGYMLSEYRIEKLLGEGGFGLTYLAFDTNLEKKVAIKEYMPSEHAIRETDSKIVAKSDSSKKVYDWGLNAFINEAKTLAKFEDPNIVRVHRFFKANGTAYIVMEYCEGGCLIDRISKDVHMPENELKQLISSLVHGLQLVHNDGILHRDIKPDNIMFRLDETPVLIDFGAARQAIGTKSRKVTTIITPGYAPLEQYSSEGTIGPWSDIYSLAAVAYLCLTGKRPPDIMNRLHEDKVTKLGAKLNSSPFLKSIDSGLELQVKNRPQSLSEWSDSWHEIKTNKKPQDTVEVITPISAKPIYANNNRPSKQDPVRRPISARAHVNSAEMTKVNKNYASLVKKKNKVSIMRVLGMVTIILGLIAIGVVSYELYLKQQKKQLIANNNNPKSSPITNQTKPINNTIAPIETAKSESVIEAQKFLNKLGFNIPEDGKMDLRTIESIKAFEDKNNLIVTGTVDDILLNELKKELTGKDETAWSNAKDTHTILSYNNYLKNFPDGLYVNQAEVNLNEIAVQEQLKIDEYNQQQADLKKQQDQQKQLSKIAAVKRQLIKNIQIELKRIKFSQLQTDGVMSINTKIAIQTYQKLRKTNQNGLPSKTLLFQLKSEINWPGRKAGEIIKDCKQCPTMVVVPGGKFTMGSASGKPNEKPPHHVRINEFIMSQTEITFDQWDACIADKVCLHNPKDDNLGRKDLAVMRINWHDIQLFLQWLNSKSQKNYRLPSEAEWEYAARAGTTTAYSWGDTIGSNNASCIGCNISVDKNKINKVKNYPANTFGLYDMHGNVWEWTADCWHPNYLGAPSDGEPWEPNGCKNFVVRGGSGGNSPEDLRSASRGVMKSTQRLNSIGFRVALDSD